MELTREYGLIRRNIWKKFAVERNHNGKDIEDDFESFHSKMFALCNAQIDRPGIVQGLEVFGAASTKKINIKAGVAIDKSGQMVVLASSEGGYAFVGNDEEDRVKHNLASGSLNIDLPNFVDTDLIVTIEHAEYDFSIDGTFYERDLVPWIRLLRKSQIAENQIVLACIKTNASGEILSISHTDGTNQRQVITHALGGINIMCPQTNSGEVSQVIAGEIRPAKDGKGIEIDCILRVRDIVFIDDSPE